MSRMKWWWTLATIRLLIWKFFAPIIFGSGGQVASLQVGYAVICAITVGLFWPEVTIKRLVKWCLLMAANHMLFYHGLRDVQLYVAMNFGSVYFVYSYLQLAAFLLAMGGISFWIFVKDTNLRAWPAAQITPDSFDCNFLRFTIDRAGLTYRIDAKNGRKGDAWFGFRARDAGPLKGLYISVVEIWHQSSVAVYNDTPVSRQFVGNTLVTTVVRTYQGSLDTSTYDNWDYLHINAKSDLKEGPLKVKVPKYYSHVFKDWFDANVYPLAR